MAGRADDDEITAFALAARDGDRDAMTSFIRATQRDVQRLVIHLSSRDVAEDLVQETYLRAFGALPRYAEEAPARTWLLSIARRVAADAVRRAQRSPRTDAVGDWAELSGMAGLARQPAEGEVLLQRLIAELDQDRRDAFVLTQILDLGYAEAAQVCGCPIGTIRSRVARARGDLAVALELRSPRRRQA